MPTKTYTREQISQHKSKDQVLFIIDNVVYDVSSFLDEHPGGHEVLIDEVGKDASEAFHDVGHSSDAKEYMKKYVVGELVEADRMELKRREIAWEDNKSNSEGSAFITSWKFPIVLGVVVTILYSYFFG